jgi:UDP-glucuronate 4-epimerase
MRVLITGSSGQIGTNTGLALLDRGDSVLGIDRHPNPWTDRIETVLLDLASVAPTDLPDDNFDAVLHLAANAKVFELVQHPERALDNVRVLFNVLDYCRRTKTPILFSSSREVYGDIHRHLTDEAHADFVVAESPYSASKIAGEAFIYSYAECYWLPYLVFRFSNVYGRYDNDLDRMERVIPLFIDRIARDQPITVFGRDKVLDFTYVDDCVSGVVAGIDALVAERVLNQTINLACGAGNSLGELVEYIGDELAKTPNVTFDDSRVGEVTRYVADITKARDLLGYSPTTTLREGITRSIAWQRETGTLAT